MISAIRYSMASPLRRLLSCCVLVVLFGGGCSEQRPNARNYSRSAAVDESRASSATPPEAPVPAETRAGAQFNPTTPALPRKIIYNAQVSLVVESLTSVADQIRQLVESSGGYVSETDTSMQTHARRYGMWKVRVPVARFDAFMAAVTKLGELQRSHLDSQDVSEEFYDLEARIANKQQEEKRLQKHLADSTGKLEDILAVERELSRVRGEIEQMQGRLRYLANQTDLSTVTITATEVKDYTPPVSPTLRTELDRTFRRSLETLARFGRGVLLFVVGASPWIVVFAILLSPLWWIVRRRFRRR